MYITKPAFTGKKTKNEILCNRIKICILLHTKASTMLPKNLNK